MSDASPIYEPVVFLPLIMAVFAFVAVIWGFWRSRKRGVNWQVIVFLILGLVNFFGSNSALGAVLLAVAFTLIVYDEIKILASRVQVLEDKIKRDGQ